MPAEVLPVDPSAPDPETVGRAARALRDGLLVIFPTETVYGLAARADRPDAVAALRAAKGREGAKPLTLHFPTLEEALRRFGPLPEGAARLAERRLPGPVTLVVPDPAGGTAGVRVPDDAVARAVLEAAGCPVVATSVNLSGEPPATTGAAAAASEAGRRAAVVLDAGPARLGKPSTVVRFEGDRVEILREGAVPADEALEDAARLMLFVCTGNLCRSPLAAAIAAKVMADRRGIGVGDLLSRGRVARSAGTAAGTGNAATPESVAEGRRLGVDLSGHRSSPVTPTLVGRSHRVFTAEASHRRAILEFVPEAARRVDLLDPAGRDLADPFGRGADAYGRMASLAAEAVRRRSEEGTLEGG